MQEGFDPYRKWLGIPPRDQPPHHYRLLGIEPFEADTDVIANAADGRMAQVKNFQGGKHAAASQRILNELAAAKVCLLNPERKAAYDRLLRQQLAARTAAPAGGAAATAAPAANDAMASFLTSVTGGAPRRTDSRAPRRRKKSLLPVAVGIALGGFLLVALAAVLLKPAPSPPIAATPAPKPSQPDRSIASKVVPSLSTKPGSQKPAAPEAEKTAAGIAVKAGAAVPPPLPEAKPAAPSPVQLSQASPAGQRPAIPSKEPAAKAAQDTAPPQASAVAPTPKPAATAAEDTRLSVPGDADQEAVEKRIRQIFQQQFSGSRAAGAKVKLAEKLFEQGVATTDDSTARFVLWRLAAETAAEGGELAKSLQIADKLDEGYRFDGLGMKADLVGTVVKSSRSGPLDADATRQSVETVVSLADVAAARDQFEIAGRLIKSAAVAGRRLKDLRLNHDLAAHGHELERLKGKFASVQKALDTLAADPSDGAANAAAGQWYCFVKENWEQGLPLLAKGNGAELAVLAKRDLAQGADAKRQVELADAWWAWAAKEPPPARSVVQARAAHWYEAALPKLSGLDKAAVEQKLKAMAPEAAASNGRGKEPKYAAGPRPEIDIAFEKQGVVDRAGHTHPTVAGALRYTAGPGGTIAAHFSGAIVDLGKYNVGSSPFTLEIGLRPQRSPGGFQQFVGWHDGGSNGALFLVERASNCTCIMRRWLPACAIPIP